MWLKNVTRIEALLFLYFIALLVHALLERELRLGMARQKIERLPLYPEDRDCRAPCTDRILEVFNSLQRHRIYEKGRLTHLYDPQLGKMHLQILELLGLPPRIFKAV